MKPGISLLVIAVVFVFAPTIVHSQSRLKMPVEKKDNSLDIALIAAINKADNTEVKRLLEQGANINAKDENGSTALALTLSKSFGSSDDKTAVSIAMTLLKHKADVNELFLPHSKRYSSLMMALWRAEIAPQDYTRLITIILERGADVNARDSEGRTALIYAAWEAGIIGRSDIVRLLLQHGADPLAHDDNNKTVLMNVALVGAEKKAVALDMLTALWKYKPDVNARNKQGMTALMEAALANNAAGVYWLIRHGADVNAVSSDLGWTPLMWAIQRFGLQEVAEILLSIGAKTSIRDKAGRRTIEMAAEHGEKPSILRLLLNRKRNVERRSVDGQTLLMLAAGANSIENVSLLIRRGAKINSQDKYGYTPLMWAIIQRPPVTEPYISGTGNRFVSDNPRTLAMVRWLLQHGARVDLRDVGGRTAHDIAIADEEPQAAALIQEFTVRLQRGH